MLWLVRSAAAHCCTVVLSRCRHAQCALNVRAIGESYSNEKKHPTGMIYKRVPNDYLVGEDCCRLSACRRVEVQTHIIDMLCALGVKCRTSNQDCSGKAP